MQREQVNNLHGDQMEHMRPLGVDTDYVLDRVHAEHVCFLSYRDVSMQSGTCVRHMSGYYGGMFSCGSFEPPESCTRCTHRISGCRIGKRRPSVS